MTGVNAKIGLGAETTWGTGVVSDRHFTCRESITEERGRLRDPMTFGTRSTLPADPGRLRLSGPLNDIPARPQTVGELLRAALGHPVTTGSGPYVHTYEPKTAKFSAAAALPPYSVNVKRSGTLLDRYTGGQLNQLELRQPADDVMLMNTDWLFKGLATATDETLALDDGERFRYKHLAVTKGGSAFPYLTDLTITIANNLDPEETLNASDEINGVDFGDKLAIGVAMTLSFQNETAVTDFRANTTSAWVFTWTISASLKLVISIPKLSLDSVQAPVDGPGRIVLTVAGTAEYDSSAAHEFEAELTNAVATYG